MRTGASVAAAAVGAVASAGAIAAAVGNTAGREVLRATFTVLAECCDSSPTTSTSIIESALRPPLLLLPPPLLAKSLPWLLPELLASLGNDEAASGAPSRGGKHTSDCM